MCKCNEETHNSTGKLCFSRRPGWSISSNDIDPEIFLFQTCSQEVYIKSCLRSTCYHEQFNQTSQFSKNSGLTYGVLLFTTVLPSKRLIKLIFLKGCHWVLSLFSAKTAWLERLKLMTRWHCFMASGPCNASQSLGTRISGDQHHELIGKE